VDALGFHLGQELSESAKRFRMRMADGDGLAFLLGVVERKLELLANRGKFLDIIEKRNIAVGAAQAGVLRGVIGDGSGGGAAVNEEEIALTKDGHKVGHERTVGRGTGALVVIDANCVGDVLQHPVNSLRDLKRSHPGVELLRFVDFIAEGLHGQMEHYLKTTAVSHFGDFAGVGISGKEGKSKRVRKGEDGIGGGTIVAHVVQDDGETRSAGTSGGLGRRRGMSLGSLTEFGTEIARRFGFVATNQADKYSEQKKRCGTTKNGTVVISAQETQEKRDSSLRGLRSE
jgi:hypothetical protein